MIGYFHQRFERGGIAHREVCQHLAIHLDARELQPVHELIVGGAFFARGGVDARNPQAAEFAFAVMAVAVMIKERMSQRFVRATIQ